MSCTTQNNFLDIGSVVVFRNRQDLKERGTLGHITHRAMVFEVYNPNSIVQVSEVLSDFRVLWGERSIHISKVIVNSLVATGSMVIVSVALLDTWSDHTGLLPGKGLRE